MRAHLPLITSWSLAWLGMCAAGAAGQGQQTGVASRRAVTLQGTLAAGSYSPGVKAGGKVFLAGQLGRDPQTGDLLVGAAAQTRQAMHNIGVVLKAAGLDHGHLVKCHVYLANMDDYVAMNEAYMSFFSGRTPARTTIEAAGLPRNAAVEIACIAHADLAGISVVEPPKGSLPTPLGPYTAAVWAGDTLYLSGMGGQFPKDRRLPDPLTEQMTQALVNIRTTLTAAKASAAEVVSSTTYFTGVGDPAGAASAYDEVFASTPAPPRTTLVVPRLPGAIKTEVTVVAVKSNVTRRAIPADKGEREARGVLAGDVLYARGESAPDAGPTLEPQFRTAMKNLEATVREAGLRWTDVVTVNVYLADLADFAEMDRLFKELFPVDPPARTTIRVHAAGKARVQVSLVAVK